MYFEMTWKRDNEKVIKTQLIPAAPPPHVVVLSAMQERASSASAKCSIGCSIKNTCSTLSIDPYTAGSEWRTTLITNVYVRSSCVSVVAFQQKKRNRLEMAKHHVKYRVKRTMNAQLVLLSFIPTLLASKNAAR